MTGISHAMRMEPTPPNACPECHRQRDQDLVQDWERSPRHRPGRVDCSSCHGSIHDGAMAARARKNEVCLGCHPRESASYLISKHGVILTLAAEDGDYSRWLSDGNYRSPTCGYCHLPRGRHSLQWTSDPVAEPSPLMTAVGAPHREWRMALCQDCHSRRLVEDWFRIGTEGLAIAAMKVREGEAVLREIVRRDPFAALHGHVIRQRMDRHLTNIRLGVGHQSPDGQWWRGQAALDGDLLRLKSLLSEVMIRSASP
ncbi:MAG: hypothetical protein HQL73_00420 [Magnetococcales bacterium]|nr:hypothetical protein [Magnetococcales bacterium]